MDHSVAFVVRQQVRLLHRPHRGHVPGEVAQTPSAAAGGGPRGRALALPAAESSQCETEPLSWHVQDVFASFLVSPFP